MTSSNPAQREDSRRDSSDYDVIVIGAGFAGLYALYRFREVLGLRVRVFETAKGVGGTWYWNRYPGARCDSESFYYCYTFSNELDQEWEWTSKYPAQPEIRRYLEHVADRFDLLRDIQFETRVRAAHFDDEKAQWQVDTDRGDAVRAQYLVTAVGCLSAANVPQIHGLDRFEGEWFHTGAWPHERVDFSGKRVGLIGTGSTGIQATPEIAAEAKHLTVFQRTPNFTIPARNAPLSADESKDIKANYAAIRAACRSNPGGFPYVGIGREVFEVSEEERENIYESLWEKGGFHFVWGSFSDILRNKAANETACRFIRAKIREIVDDPEIAERLCPTNHPYGSKRPPIDTNYYVTFNEPHVELVDVDASPIVEIEAKGVRTEGGFYPLDTLVFATGFDAMTGSLLRIDIRGSSGLRLEEKWSEGPKTYLGLQIAGFPNLFTITGPGSPSVLMNMPVAIEQHVDWISGCIEHAARVGASRVEAAASAEEEWVQHVNDAARETLYYEAKSWYLGHNIPGKPEVFMPYVGGQIAYREKCEAVVEAGYEGFEFDAREN